VWAGRPGRTIGDCEFRNGPSRNASYRVVKPSWRSAPQSGAPQSVLAQKLLRSPLSEQCISLGRSRKTFVFGVDRRFSLQEQLGRIQVSAIRGPVQAGLPLCRSTVYASAAENRRRWFDHTDAGTEASR
jgi:hypothetical protein